ncbi:hypothetical protein SNA_28100 [Streptomyces natalensis ATCC 27448]|uniref:Bacterial toxin 50 domain-containing protein n=2 Tax=Streptomyces natalensis TaxID=68242 RepID=A0A0D7CGV2_9ACTN|nr:hypothetical protein SNA_28100 [Streptomyces natalensis ATCC 27448]
MVDEAVEKHGFGQGITPMDAFNGITPQPPAKPEKKGWFQQYITDPIKNGIEDVGDFMSSVFNWRSILDAGSMALGTFLMAAGGGMEVGGFALDGTGAGAAVGIPVNVAGAAVFTSGATLAAGGFGDFMTQMSEGGVDNAWDRSGSRGSSGGGPEPRPVSSEEQEAFTKNQEELAKLSKNKQITEVKKGIERDGKKYKPEQDLLSGKKHGIDWTEGPARLEKEGKPQGQFGSPADVHFATEKGAELGPRNQGIFKLPEGNTCIQYELDDTGAVQIVKPDSIFVKVYPNGKIHAYPFKR